MTINLGDKVQDSVSGFKGTAIGRTVWLHGCNRITVQPTVGKDGKMGESATFDEPQLRIIKRARVPEGNHERGGFSIEPRQRATPARA